MFANICRRIHFDIRFLQSISKSACTLRRRTMAATLASLMAFVAMVCAQSASAGATIINGSECVPFVSAAVPAVPGTPLVFPYGNRLDIFRSGSDWNFIVNCNFPLHSSPELATGEVTVAVVDGKGLSTVRLCFGSYYTDAIACGPNAAAGGPPYAVYPPASMPSGATAPFILASATVTASNTPVKIRSFTGFWSAP